jgi:hypothetical protein
VPQPQNRGCVEDPGKNRQRQQQRRQGPISLIDEDAEEFSADRRAVLD